MIFRSLIVVIVLLIIFEISLRVCIVNWDTGQSDKSANLIGAQNFVYNYSKLDLSKHTIIVGSSKSRKLIIDSLGENIISLAFNGWGAYDGLDLLKRSKSLPSCILIEKISYGNVVTQQEIVSIFDPLYSYKEFIKSTQLQNQPVGLLVGFLKDQMKAKILASKKLKRSNVGMYNSSIQIIKKNYSKPFDNSTCTSSLDKIKSMVNEFENKNVKIIFFEVPIDASLMHTSFMDSARNYYTKYFPQSAYSNIDPIINNYVYSDGIHLLPESALEYTNFLKKCLFKINSPLTN